MQEDQYQKYFDEINKIEYKKVYDSLNNQNYEKEIYDKILNSDSSIDYSEFWKKNQNLNPISIMPETSTVLKVNFINNIILEFHCK